MQPLMSLAFCVLAVAQVPPATSEPVGKISANCYYTPANQRLTPHGVQVELPGMRPQVIALSPDGKRLVTAGKMLSSW